MLEDDWATPVRDKLDRLARMCPRPSRLEVDACGRLLRVLCADAGAVQPSTFRDQVRECMHPLCCKRGCERALSVRAMRRRWTGERSQDTRTPKSSRCEWVI